MKIVIDKTEFEAIGYFESEDTLYMSMIPPSKITIDEIETLVRENKSIICGEETFTGYTNLDAVSFTYHTRINEKTTATALNIQTKRS